MKTKRLTEAITLTLGAKCIAYLHRVAEKRQSSASQVVRDMVIAAMDAEVSAAAHPILAAPEKSKRRKAA